MDTTDKYIYTIRDDGKVVGYDDMYHYLSDISYRMDTNHILNAEAREIMIKELENEGYFGGYLYGAHFEYADTSDIYDLYLEKIC